ncbi:MAG TPA: hypothetical protein VG227_04245, partial [Caulobacteraceae bacterium]|nr:hypothetical protein [Caulobacteraceae bacterium]
MQRHVPLALCLVISSLAACAKAPASGDPHGAALAASVNASVTVPFVGCAADGQTGPRPAPAGGPKKINVDPALAPRLAWYASQDVSALAPRGWSCFERYGSSGALLVVAPAPLNLDTADPSKLATAVVAGGDSGGTSGRFAVAQVIARAFPDRAAFLRSVVGEGTLPPSDFPSGPYPTDQVTDIGGDALAFHTPAQTGGLGPLVGGFTQGDQPIDGVVFLSGADTDMDFLALRLPADLQELGPAIVQAYEETNLPRPASTPLAAAQGFYDALANGDGTDAARFIIPAKRAAGPLSADALTRFYGALAQPLKLLGAEQKADGSVAVQYAYAVSGGRSCAGAAVVSTEASGS